MQLPFESRHQGKSRRQFRLGLRTESRTIFSDISQKLKDATIDYVGDPANHERNRARAIIGAGAALVGYVIDPIIGFIALGYTGVKVYQAHQDKRYRR